jgi:hypothetical protein
LPASLRQRWISANRARFVKDPIRRGRHTQARHTPLPELPKEHAMYLSPVFFHRCVAFAAGLLLAGIGVVNP